jgi:hypothetical protein
LGFIRDQAGAHEKEVMAMRSPVILDALYRQRLDIPIRVVVSEEQKERFAGFLVDYEVVLGPVGPAKLDGFAAEVESEV